MRIACKFSDPYYYIAPRQTSYGDFAAQLILLMPLPLGYTARFWGMEAVDLAAQLILLMPLPLGYTARFWGMEAVDLVVIYSLLANNALHNLYHGRVQPLLTQPDPLPLEVPHLATCYRSKFLQGPAWLFSMPSQAGIVQALHHQAIALVQLNPTSCSDGITLCNDLLVEFSVGREGDIFLLHSDIYDDFFSLLDFVLMQGYGEGNSFLMPFLPGDV